MYGLWIIPLLVFVITKVIIKIVNLESSLPAIILGFISFVLLYLAPLMFIELETTEKHIEEIELQPFLSSNSYLESFISDGKVNFLYSTVNEKNEYEVKKVYYYETSVKILNDGKPYLKVKEIKLKSKFSRWIYGSFTSYMNDNSKTRTGYKYEFYIPEGTVSVSTSETN